MRMRKNGRVKNVKFSGYYFIYEHEHIAKGSLYRTFRVSDAYVLSLL